MNASGHRTKARRQLARMQTILFLAGIALVVGSTALANAVLLLAGGVCVTASGALLCLGLHSTLDAPMGALVRSGFGPQRAKWLYVRALTWIAIGFVLAAVSAFQLIRATASGIHAAEPPVKRAN